MKTVKRNSTYQGPIIINEYNEQKSKKNVFGRDINKTITAKKTTDLNNKSVEASGVMTKTVSKDGVTLKTKTKKISPNQIINRGY